MSARSKLFILASFLACSSAMAEPSALHVRLQFKDIKNPERVMEYLKTASKKDKQLAESSYQRAQRDTQRLQTGASWGSVSKGSSESLMSYPMAKTYLLSVEAKLRSWAEYRVRDPELEKEDPGRAKARLQFAASWLEVAILVDAYEPTLSDSQRKHIVSYRDCLRRYLETDKLDTDCVPLQWSGEVRAAKK